MGIIKKALLFGGIPVRPTTGRERSRRYQRETNRLLEEILNQGLVSDDATLGGQLAPSGAEGQSGSDRMIERIFAQVDADTLRLQELRREVAALATSFPKAQLQCQVAVDELGDLVVKCGNGDMSQVELVEVIERFSGLIEQIRSSERSS